MADSYVGEIRIFAGIRPPRNWHFCDGSKLPITEYQALFSLLGTVWGGDGRTTFGIPDLRGRLAVGQGTGPGLTPRVLAQTGGTETVTITAAAMPAHNHGAAVSGAVGTTNVPGPGVLRSALTAPDVGYLPAAQQSTTFAFDASMVGTEGGNAPHTNVMPYVALNYMISLLGTYPDKP